MRIAVNKQKARVSGPSRSDGELGYLPDLLLTGLPMSDWAASLPPPISARPLMCVPHCSQRLTSPTVLENCAAS